MERAAVPIQVSSSCRTGSRSPTPQHPRETCWFPREFTASFQIQIGRQQPTVPVERMRDGMSEEEKEPLTTLASSVRHSKCERQRVAAGPRPCSDHLIRSRAPAKPRSGGRRTFLPPTAPTMWRSPQPSHHSPSSTHRNKRDQAPLTRSSYRIIGWSLQNPQFCPSLSLSFVSCVAVLSARVCLTAALSTTLDTLIPSR